MKEHPHLCRNMSAPPKTTITYTGLCADLTAGGRDDKGINDGVYGTPVRFAVPADLAGHSPAAILKFLGERPRRPPEAHLLELIEARAAELPLPDGCAVVPPSHAHCAPWPDALSGLAVLTKCSAAVWLQVKSPVLGAALRRHEVSLLVPPAFANALPEIGP